QERLPLFPGEHLVFYENERTETVVVDGQPVTLTRLEEWSAFLDVESRTLTFELLNVDLEPGASDVVMFSIRPLPQRPEGTDIVNSADIQFEIFETLTTNETINTVDVTAPSCEVEALPAVSPTGPLTLTWAGEDGGSGIQDYSLFMAVDDGGFEAMQRGPHTESVIADLEDGRTYRFLCLARDRAGNREAPSDVAEATTVAVETLAGSDADGGGCGCRSSGAPPLALLFVLGLAGRRRHRGGHR
ncbi:MAG: MYXO-CTERM sorting domain-containing protein, partial [Myxococcota bacterium]